MMDKNNPRESDKINTSLYTATSKNNKFGLKSKSEKVILDDLYDQIVSHGPRHFLVCKNGNPAGGGINDSTTEFHIYEGRHLHES